VGGPVQLAIEVIVTIGNGPAVQKMLKPFLLRISGLRFRPLLVALAFLVVHPADAQVSSATPDHVLIVGTKEAPPFAMKEHDGSWTGLSIELWRRIADTLHLHYRLQEVPLDELINGTAAGRLDAAIAAITVTAPRVRTVDFSEPYYHTGLGIAVPRQGTFEWLRDLGSLISPSFLKALLGLIGVILLIGVIVWVIERRHTEHFRGGVKEGLASSVWWSAVTMAQSVPDRGPSTLLGRLVGVFWMAASVAAIAVFTAGITTQLTMKQVQGTVHSVADLQSDGGSAGPVRVGAVEGTAAIGYLLRERINFRTYPDTASGLRAVKAGALDAFVYDRPLLQWLAKKDYEGSIEVLDITFDQQGYAIALPYNSTLRMPINRALLAIIETQWWRDLNTKYLGDRF
jgi:polar amino acid transport system substrate-binding protein